MVLAIINGTVRNKVYKPVVGDLTAHQISTAIFVTLIFVVTYLILQVTCLVLTDFSAIVMGAIWVTTTVLFEFVAGHYVFKNPWEKLVADYNLFKGRVWLLVLFASFLAPYLLNLLRQLGLVCFLLKRSYLPVCSQYGVPTWMCCLLSSSCKICLEPVAIVKTKAVGKEVRDKNVVSQLVFREDLLEALDGVEDFSHLFVLFWLHEMSNQDRTIMKVHPRGRADMPLLGLFATRTPRRPNPIGLTRVKLLKKEGNVLIVQGLDAYNGTPVLDIKPFDRWDTTENFKVADWWKQLETEKNN